MSEAANFLDVLRRNGHIGAPEAYLVPLSGGVSSEIYVVHDGERKFVVKCALQKLKVKDDWFADISRNKSEQLYIEFVSKMMPGAVPQVYFSCPADGYFGMELLDERFVNWKTLLLNGDCRTRHSELAGNLLCEIHCRSACDADLSRQFDTTETFHQLRIEPYLLTTGARHPALKAIFVAEAARMEATREALVHGDFSPKNILINGDRMVLLDCEAAWYGDPVFDVAFMLNHIFLKALYHAPKTDELGDMASSFWMAYARESPTSRANQIERRLAPLLLMLLLARVDGKSPVEYLPREKQEFIRAFVHQNLPSSPRCFAELRDLWFRKIIEADFAKAGA